MKQLTSIFIITLLTVFFSSCSKCYECTTVHEYEVNGVMQTDTVSEDYCTASSQELQEKEDAGYDCSPA
ncbi:MAG: hypothetical protein COA57_12215 [Flavobacteriales bacterium]|nr:MAG: hypothetical protein COA57_12215 [Flavobacteriales bacterium]